MTGLDPALVLRHTLPWFALASIAVLHVSLRPLLGSRLAGIASLALVVDPLITFTASTPRPESSQFCAWLLVLAAAAWCLQPTPGTWRRQFTLGLACGGAFLIKFNSLALVPICLIAALVPARRLQRAAAMAAGAALMVVAFLACYHRPSVGTWALNLGTGWHRMCNLEALDVDVCAEAGPNSRLSQMLVSRLPPVEAGEFAFLHLRGVARQERQPYLDRWQALLDAPDCVRVDASCCAAVIARENAPDVRKPESFYRLYHLLGLERAERLLNAVWWETVRHQPERYIRGFVERMIDGAHFTRHYRPYLPLQLVQSAVHRCFTPVLYLGNGTQRMVDAAASSHARPAAASLLGSLGLFTRVPDVLLWLLLSCSAVRHGVALCRRSSRARLSWLAVAAWPSLVALLFFSGLTLTFRVKELVVAIPIIVLGITALFRSPVPGVASRRLE